MSWLSVTLLTVALAGPPARSTPDAASLAQLVSAIRSADYRGERDALRRLAAALDEIELSSLSAHREYWRGFALWRSAINGGNEIPMPADVRVDLEAAIQAFRGALQHSPGWVEPKIGLLFCWVGLFSAPGADPSQPAVSRAEFETVARELKEKGQENPRALWFLGGSLFFAPPPHGGDPPRAVETYRRGLQAARDETLRSAGANAPEWVPSWGAAENLMGLAYLYSHSALQDRDLAQAYADGALALAPDWHYVRDILVPQIQALPPRAP